MFLLIIASLIYFLGFKKYYICIKDVSAANREELTKVLKHELALALSEITRIYTYQPYDLFVGTFLETFVVKRKIAKTGAEVSMFMRWAWKKCKEGPRNESEPLPVKDPDGANEEAWAYINEIESLGVVNENNELELKFTSAEDALKVDEMLDKIEMCADNPIEESLYAKILYFRYMVSWSLKRHWTHSWMLIGGAILSVFIFSYCNSDSVGRVSGAEYNLEAAENWEEADTTFAEFPKEITYYNNIKDPKQTKSDVLCRLYDHYEYEKGNYEYYKTKADTTTDKSIKKESLEIAEEYQEKVEEALEEYNEVNEMDFDDFQDYYVDILEDRLDAAQGNAFFFWLFFFALIIMIPLYIMASYQYGYIIDKYEKETNVLNKIKKSGFALAAGLFGAGLAMQFFPSTRVKTYWSDGSTSTHTEENPANFIIMALKIGLFIAAAFVVCFVSCFLMAYLTITGLYRNYNWKAMYNKTQEKINEASEMIKEKRKK